MFHVSGSPFPLCFTYHYVHTITGGIIRLRVATRGVIVEGQCVFIIGSLRLLVFNEVVVRMSVNNIGSHGVGGPSTDHDFTNRFVF